MLLADTLSRAHLPVNANNIKNVESLAAVRWKDTLMASEGKLIKFVVIMQQMKYYKM